MPSHREKKRYLLVKSGKSSFKDIREFRKHTNLAIREFLGVLGMSKASLKFIDSGSSDFGTSSFREDFWAILCVNRSMVEQIRAAFCVFSENKNSEGIRIENVSGTLKKLREQGEKKNN